MSESDILTDEKLLTIDEYALDKECVKLPNQYRQIAFLAAEAARDLDEAKATRSTREAELVLKIRSNPGAFHLEKVTEGTLKEMVQINPGIQKHDKRIREIQHRYDLLKALVNALETKKRSLTNLVELHSAGYHAEVRPSSAGRESLDKLSRSRMSQPISRDRKTKGTSKK